MNTNPITPTQRSAAKIAGFAYIILFVAGIIAEFVLRSGIIVSGDATATVQNILASETLFRSSLALDLLMIVADLVVAVALYVLLRPINRYLALLTMLFRLIMDAILGVNLLNLLMALTLIDGNTGTGSFDTEQINALAMAFIDLHAIGYSVGLLPFAFATLIVGYLLYTSNYVPRILAAMLALAGLTYLTGSTIHIIAPNLEESFSYAYVIPLIAEGGLALWLAFKGVGFRNPQTSPVPATAS